MEYGNDYMLSLFEEKLRMQMFIYLIRIVI